MVREDIEAEAGFLVVGRRKRRRRSSKMAMEVSV